MSTPKTRIPNRRAPIARCPYFKNGKHANELELLQKAVLCVRSKSTEFFQVAANLLCWASEPGNYTRVSPTYTGQLNISRIELYLGWVLDKKPPCEIKDKTQRREAPHLFKAYMRDLARRVKSGELDETIEANARPPSQPPERRHQRGRPESPAITVFISRLAVERL